jgi:hypothetical protein
MYLILQNAETHPDRGRKKPKPNPSSVKNVDSSLGRAEIEMLSWMRIWDSKSSSQRIRRRKL